MRIPVLLLLFLAFPYADRAVAQTFSWDRATLYDVVTDRFSNGDSDNNGAYGRGLDGTGTPYAVDSTGHFLGGDWAGLTGWLEDGWFEALGVDVLVVSAPFEQVHGWVPGSDPSVQHYAYDGRAIADYTTLDAAFGSPESFAGLVAAAHERGVRVVIDLAFGHPGPVTLHDMAEFGFGTVADASWRSWRPGPAGWPEGLDRYILRSDSTDAWLRWWGSDWVLANLAGYSPCGDTCAGRGVSFRDDATSVGIPPFLALKWGESKTAEQTAWLSGFLAARSWPMTPTHIRVAWLSSWVRSVGIDGIRVADFHALPEATRALLATELSAAHAAWRSANPDRALPPAPFQVLAPVEPLTDALSAPVDSVFAQSVGQAAISAISSVDSGLSDRSRLLDDAFRLVFMPGPIQMVYGDETGRAGHPRSFMNWDSVDEEVLATWRLLGSFRRAHPAVAGGEHLPLSDAPHVFARVRPDDKVVVVRGATERLRVNVARVWPDDTAVKDVVTGRIGIVSFGQLSMTPDPSGLMLLEEVD